MDQITLTKYYSEKHKFDNNYDTPIAVRDYTNVGSDRTYYCSWCQRNLIKLHGRSGENVSYYCNFCSVESNPEEKELRSKSRIEPHEGTNKVPLASTKFPEYSVSKPPTEIRGSFKTLQSKGMRIRNYKDSVKG